MRFRFASLFPVVTGAVAVALAITLLAIGSSTSSANVDDAWLVLNTTDAGKSQFTITQSTNNQGSGNADPNSLQGILNGLLNGLTGNLTSLLNSAAQDIQGQIIGNVTQALNIKDTYALFITHICEGDYLERSNPNSETRVTDCYSYDDRDKGLRRVSENIPQNFIIGTANVTVPLIQVLGSTLSLLVGIMTVGSRFMAAMLAIGCAATGLAVVGSAVFVVAAQHRAAVVAYTALSGLGAAALYVFAISGTAISHGSSGVLNQGGNALGMYSTTSPAFLAMAWLSAVFAGFAAAFWWVVWYVEFRRHAYKKRVRSPHQVGNYKGAWAEFKDDHTVAQPAPLSKEEAAVTSSAQPVPPTRAV